MYRSIGCSSMRTPDLAFRRIRVQSNFGRVLADRVEHGCDTASVPTQGTIVQVPSRPGRRGVLDVLVKKHFQCDRKEESTTDVSLLRFIRRLVRKALPDQRTWCPVAVLAYFKKRGAKAAITSNIRWRARVLYALGKSTKSGDFSSSCGLRPCSNPVSGFQLPAAHRRHFAARRRSVSTTAIGRMPLGFFGDPNHACPTKPASCLLRQAAVDKIRGKRCRSLSKFSGVVCL